MAFLGDGKKDLGQDLLEGSWRGIPLLIVGGNVSGGRKATAKAIYNSDLQDVADTGMQQRSYSVNGYIAATYGPPIFPGDSGIKSEYRKQRKDILAALEEKGPGVLVHPFQGEVRDLVVLSYSLDETINETGIGKIAIQFARKTVNAVPKVKEAAEFDYSWSFDLWALLRLLAESLYSVALSVVGVFEAALDQLLSVYETIQSVVDTVTSVAASINGFASAITEAVAKAASIITSPLAIISAIQNVFTSFNTIFSTLDEAFSALASGFTFGDDDDLTEKFTFGEIQIQKNTATLTTVMKTMFLTEAYTAATGMDLSTLAKIEEVEEILDAQHKSIVEGTQASPEIKEQMQLMREAFFEFLAGKKLTALKVTNEDISPTTPRVLAYRLYGDTKLKGELASLNNAASFEVLSGNVKVLSR
jgi:prophage DNA circulation protein